MKLPNQTILQNTLVLILVVLSILSLFMIRDFIGYAVGSDTFRGGYIKEIEIIKTSPANNWHGIYGIAVEVAALNSSWFVFSNPSDTDEVNPLYPCFEENIDHEIYATTLSSSQISWNDVQAANTSEVDAWIGVDPSSVSSATYTFTNSISFDLGARTLNNVPATYTYQYNTPGSTEFPVGLLMYNGTPITVALVNNDYPTGFRPDKIFNYQMFVPVKRNTTNTRVNLYWDPFESCPEGQGDEGNETTPGNVYGWVSDNTTLAFLDQALVAIDAKISITGSDGFYNFSSVESGDYYIIAIRSGYKNFVGNISIPSNGTVEYNISMEQSSEDLTGTGPGVGTGVGPGEDAPGDSTKSKSGDGPGVGPGIGPGIGPYLEQPRDFGILYWMSLDQLRKRIRQEQFFDENLLIFSFYGNPIDIDVTLEGNISQIMEISPTEATINTNEYANISIRGLGLKLGTYTGSIVVDGEFNDSLPVEIIVSNEEKLPIEALLIQLNSLTTRPLPGNLYKFRVQLQNLLIEEQYQVWLDYYIRGVDSATSNYSMYVGNSSTQLLTTETLIEEVLIPPDWPKGEYILIIEARYFDLFARTTTLFEVFEPFYEYKVFGAVEIWKIAAALSSIALIIGIVLFIKKRQNAKKRFHAKVEYKLLPQKGPRSIYVGQLAETTKDTYFDMDILTVHSIVAGSTGGGKSISAQVIIEECLMKDVAVVVFDPTAQWSGMLRKCQDEKMMSFYPRFHLTKKDARAFSGNIRAIKNPLEKIDLQKYWKPGEIQVITTSTLDPKGMDIFVANTVREVFRSNLQEFRGLRMMMVYDEVHRLLPKFGGSGEGFVQIERACREFRKWGIGVMLISQVLADFVGQIKANINTEVQMKTRDEGDLNRIKTKYGDTYVQELVKSPVGSGMVQNSAWNRGRPYYVTFRPILHSVVRLADEELEQYNKYNEIVNDLQYQLEQLEKEGKDVFDLTLELKLALDKIKQGSFNMVEIYLEGLKPRIEKIWKELGKAPKKWTLELVSEAELMDSIKQAQEDSAKAKANEASAQGEEAKKMTINDDVAPEDMLNLCNGTLVVKLNALIDEINVLKDDEFKKHVNDKKNDFSTWIRKAYHNDGWADIADQIITKEDYVKFLELLAQGKEKTFKPKTKREAPFSSKQEQAPKEESKKESKETQNEAAKKEGKEAGAAQSGSPSGGTQPPTTQPPTQQQTPPSQQPQAGNQAPSQQSMLQQIAAEQQKAQQTQAQFQATPKAQFDFKVLQQSLTAKTPQEKISAYMKQLSDHPQNFELLFSLGAEYHRLQDFPSAETYYKKALDVDANNLNTMFYLGSVLSKQNKIDEALSWYKKIASIKPDYPKVQQYIQSLQQVKT